MTAEAPAVELSDHATPRRRRGRARRLPAASLIVSIVLHTGLLALGAIVVYEAAVAERPIGREVAVDFLAPGQSQIPPPPVALPEHNASGETALVFGAAPDQPPAPISPPPALAGLSSSTPDAPTAPGSSLLGVEDLGRLFGDASTTGAARADQAVTFAGLGASSARSVVYVVDCSGPMVTSLPFVLAEVRRSISRLSPTQKFGVILFRRTQYPALESFAPVLVRATPSAQERLAQWLPSAEPTGRSSPLAGLEAALEMKPDAIFLLSRAIDRSGGAVWDGGLAATMARLEQLNPRDRAGRRPVSIQTIQFLDEDPTGTMQAIGTQHGAAAGSTGYRVVRRGEDLSTR